VVDVTPIESAIVTLARKAQVNPAGLNPGDLQPMSELVGDSALEYALVLCSFHGITRVADQVGAKTETPAPLRRIGPIRRMVVRAGGLWLRTMMKEERSYATTFQQAIENIRPIFERAVGRPPGDELESLSPRPQLVELLQLALEEKLERSTLPRETLRRVYRIVEEQLPSGAESSDSTRVHDDPIESFAAIGTRYPYRTTAAMVDALRETGLDDLAVLDLAVAVSDSNVWARFCRLFGLRPEIYYS